MWWKVIVLSTLSIFLICVILLLKRPLRLWGAVRSYYMEQKKYLIPNSRYGYYSKPLSLQVGIVI